MLRRSPLKRNGRRTNDWRKVWRFLKAEFEKRNITYCEFGFIEHECGGFLTPAHSKKRRMMQGTDIYAVALSCVNFHRQLDEGMSHEQMEQIVMQAISNRGGLILPK